MVWWKELLKEEQCSEQVRGLTALVWRACGSRAVLSRFCERLAGLWKLLGQEGLAWTGR